MFMWFWTIFSLGAPEKVKFIALPFQACVTGAREEDTRGRGSSLTPRVSPSRGRSFSPSTSLLPSACHAGYAVPVPKSTQNLVISRSRLLSFHVAVVQRRTTATTFPLSSPSLFRKVPIELPVAVAPISPTTRDKMADGSPRRCVSHSQLTRADLFRHYFFAI